DATGQPVPGKPVLFRVSGGDGTVDGGKRGLAVTSDASGQALVHFTTGTRAGAGNQMIEASAPGFGPPAVFLASAQPGAPALIVVDSGDQQLGVAGQALPRPLVATVVDAGSNRLPGVAATFRVVKGAGQFANGLQTMPLTTDGDGRLIATLTTDPSEGVADNIVEARIDALPTGPVASFVASTWAAGDPGLTAVSGVVLDNSSLPIAGVTVRIRDTALTASTDAQGLFQISPVPAGTLKLIVDGSTAQRPGAWPDLEFELTTVPGRNNTLRMPIYLLPLDLATGVQVDETHGGTLTLPQLPGFALQIQPGSVTFPAGGRSGLVSVTVVHSDKVPMVPNFGQQPRLIVTIQPAGARFDPPARLTLPNVEGLAPGKVTEFYSFDHDLGHFVSIGPGTVSDDGAVVTSNVGVGILKAGWHCCGDPQSSGSAADCPECKMCGDAGNQCVPKPLCSFCSAVGSACDGNGSCLTGAALLPQICSLLKTTVTEAPSFTCKQCGIGVFRTYSTVSPNCQTVSLTGTTLTEDADLQQAPPGGRLCSTNPIHLTGLNCPIHSTTPTDPDPPGGPCTDHVEICGLATLFPMGTCQEVVKQIIKVGDCQVETHTFIFTITRTATSCSGSRQEQ
ncbi:MAG TPA: carboxypeptidase regulatory-like domain-containing protein, partial [Mycobacterium sp.]|nr:carboxypeptidase regulatory-like domain-containing protein [Mycobacterium sp.]